LAAKDVIDVQVSVHNLADEGSFTGPLERLGYRLLPDPEELDHRFFRRPEERPRRTNIHVCQAGGEWERTHLLFRDFLRARPDEAVKYELVKREMADRHRANRYDYTDAKGPYIREAQLRADRWAALSGWDVAGSREDR
jgi:GrpB-like predicted nucleotidyltransferase (UPF0157 family)